MHQLCELSVELCLFVFSFEKDIEVSKKNVFQVNLALELFFLPSSMLIIGSNFL